MKSKGKFAGLLLVLLFLSPFASFAYDASRPIVFIIDSSGSMKGERIQATKSAVKTIVESLAPEQPIAIISFNQQVKLIFSSGTNRTDAINSINLLQAGGNTSLYDALAYSLQKLPNASQYILLSDGADTTSKTSLNSILSKIPVSKQPIFSIGVQVSSGQRGILTDIANASNGKYYQVEDINLLIDTYRKILAEVLASTSPAPVTKVEPQTQLPRSSEGPTPISIAMSVVVFVLVLMLLINLRDRANTRKQYSARLRVLQDYTTRNLQKTMGRLRSNFVKYAFVPSRVEGWIKNKLDLIHSSWKYESVIRLMILSWIFLIFTLSFVLGSMVLGLVFASALVPLSFKFIVSSIMDKQRQSFANELPDLLNILASALRSGLSLPQGLEAYSSDAESEVARQIRRAVAEIKVGTAVDDALMGVAERMENEDLRWAVTALSIQRVVGGSLATILTTAFETVKSRAEIRREVKTLSAEGKLSAYVLMALPIGIFLFLFLTRREYVKVLYSTAPGLVMSMYVVSSLAIGWTWMKKIVEIKI